MPSVLAVTTSMGTKWEAYCQTMLRLEVPQWKRLVIDGRSNWTPLGFLTSALEADTDYIVHVDEDCFVQSGSALEELVGILERNPGICAAGIPDGGHYYREMNPAALNLFFVVFRTSSLRKAWLDRENWSRLKFEDRFADDIRRQRPDLLEAKVNWSASEPYYPLFWKLLSQGDSFLYLFEGLNRDRWSTIVKLPSGQPLVEHLWYLRNWFSSSQMPGHDCPNVQRYRSYQKRVLMERRTDFRFWLSLTLSNARRLFRRFTS